MTLPKITGLTSSYNIQGKMENETRGTSEYFYIFLIYFVLFNVRITRKSRSDLKTFRINEIRS